MKCNEASVRKAYTKVKVVASLSWLERKPIKIVNKIVYQLKTNNLCVMNSKKKKESY